MRQRVAVRLLAWSTVAQAGWVLLPLGRGWRPQRPAPPGRPSAASVGYLVAYVVASLAAFAVVVVFARHHPAGEDHTLEAYRGLARREPVAAAVLGFALLCLAGLPPGVVGLVAKVVAVRPVVDAGVWWLALVAAANVALGIVYYVRWTALLVVRPDGVPPTWRVTTAEGVALGASVALCVGFSVLPEVVAGLVPTPCADPGCPLGVRRVPPGSGTAPTPEALLQVTSPFRRPADAPEGALEPRWATVTSTV